MHRFIRLVTLIFFTLNFTLFVNGLKAWPAHPLIAGAALKNHPHWKNALPVEAKTLEQFVVDNKTALVDFLATFEQWSIANLPHYIATPDDLAFDESVSDQEALKRFLMALRLNPGIKVPLYLHVPVGSSSSLPEIDPQQVTTLTNLSGMNAGVYVGLKPGMEVDPFLVLLTANDEPDYGFDLGLFEDNQTDYGRIYGFGNQTFGNPNLEYSSQAPFHMGFYYESAIVFKFAPFLHKTFLNYRHNQFRALAEFAFRQKEHYWGYRFLGWSMHYLADATMPYHVKPLPGYSTIRMLWVNMKSMMGFEKAQRNAVQLVSNRHTAIEDYLQQRLIEIYRTNSFDDPLYQSLTIDQTLEEVGTDYLVKNAAYNAVKATKVFDKAVRKSLPNDMVNDPSVEVSRHERIKDIAQYTREVMSKKRVSTLEKAVAEHFVYLGMVLRSMISTMDNKPDSFVLN